MNHIPYQHVKEQRNTILKANNVMNSYPPDLHFVFRYALLSHRNTITTSTLHTVLHCTPQSMQLEKQTKKAINRGLNKVCNVLHFERKELITSDTKPWTILILHLQGFAKSARWFLSVTFSLGSLDKGKRFTNFYHCSRSNQGEDWSREHSESPGIKGVSETRPQVSKKPQLSQKPFLGLVRATKANP